MNPTVDPAMILRAYLWAVLKANDPDIWHESKYGGLIPIVPFGEEPEVNEYPGPHIVYSYVHTPSNGPRSKGGLTFAIADDNITRMSKTVNIINAAFDRDDESAGDVNTFSSNVEINGEHPFVGIRFGYVRAAFSEGPLAPESEGGRAMTYIDLDYEYYVDYAVITKV